MYMYQNYPLALKGKSIPKLIQFEKKEYIFSYRTVKKLWKLDEK